MPPLELQSKISLNDARSRILRLPASIREALPEELETLDVYVPAVDFQGALTIAAGRTYVAAVTDLYRLSGILRSTNDGLEARPTTVDWSFDPDRPAATLTFTPAGDWTPVKSAQPGNASTPEPPDPAVMVANGVAQLTPEREATRARAIAEAHRRDA